MLLGVEIFRISCAQPQTMVECKGCLNSLSQKTFDHEMNFEKKRGERRINQFLQDV